MPRITYCPQCRKSVKYSLDNPYRPFCSQRCQQIDLGAWVEEEYRLPSQDAPDEEFMENDHLLEWEAFEDPNKEPQSY